MTDNYYNLVCGRIYWFRFPIQSSQPGCGRGLFDCASPSLDTPVVTGFLKTPNLRYILSYVRVNHWPSLILIQGLGIWNDRRAVSLIRTALATSRNDSFLPQLCSWLTKFCAFRRYWLWWLVLSGPLHDPLVIVPGEKYFLVSVISVVPVTWSVRKFPCQNKYDAQSY